MGSMIWGIDSIDVDLIDDAHIDTISFATQLGDELARFSVSGRAPIEYRWPGPAVGYVCAKAWRDGVHLATLDTKRLLPGDGYRVDFGEPRAKPERLTDEWRVTWTEIREWPEYGQLRSEVFGDQGHALRLARFFAVDRADVGEIRVERRRVTPWELVDPFTLSDESTSVDKPARDV